MSEVIVCCGFLGFGVCFVYVFRLFVAVGVFGGLG